MKTKVEALQDNQVKLTVTIDAKEIDSRIKKTYKDFAYKYNFPGFRRGKAPRPVIDNALGAEAVRATVTDALINETYPVAVDEAELYPIGQAKFDDQDAMVESGKAFSYVATLGVKPEFELSSYEPVEIELPGEEATDEEIEDQINALREHYYSFEDATAATKIEEGGFADISISAKDENGEELDSLASESRLYGLGSGLFPPAFDEALIGLKKGQKKSFDIEPKGLFTMGLASVAGKADKIHFDIEVKAVKKKVLPEVTEEWAKETCGFESLEDLKTRIAENITQSKQEMLPRLKENECLAQIGERFEGEVPESMINSAETELLQNFFQQLQSQGASLDAYLNQQGITIDQFKDDVKKQAEEITRQDLALDAWARNKDMKITGKELTEEFQKSGAEDPKALEAEWRANGQLHILRQGILRSRAAMDVMDTAIVTEPGKAKKKTTKKGAAKKEEGETKAATKKAAPKAAAEKKSAEDAKGGEKAPAKKAPAKKASAKKASPDEKAAE